MRRDVVNRIERVIKDLWPTARVCISFCPVHAKNLHATNSISGGPVFGGRGRTHCNEFVYSAHYLVNLRWCCSNTLVGVFAHWEDSVKLV